jgi:hypothetical protein
VGRPPQRSRTDLVKLLAEQRAALAASSEGFDKGNEWEAPRLATTAFTLVHDGGGIRSVLSQLGLRGSLRFLSSGRLISNPNVISSSPPLLIARMDQNGVQFKPKLDDLAISNQIVQFETWWAKEAIYKESGRDGASLTRRRLIFSMRHQDGGGHVGPLTDPAYITFKAGGGWFGGSGDGSRKALDMAAAATMRQIAWELTETLKGLGEVQ